MITKLSSHMRSGLVALSVLAGVSAPAVASPLAAGFHSPVTLPAASENPLGVTPVQGDGRFSDCLRGGRCDRNFFGRGSSRYFDGDRRGRRHWRRGWDDDGRWRRRHWRRHWDDDGWRYRRHRRSFGPSIYLNFGVPAYRYADPYYYQPRRVYRSYGSSRGHVEWCYSRYRSYRAWDNTFQPYYGPRRQCISPFS